jgi:cadmium resistance protein CadD (predicted permease)
MALAARGRITCETTPSGRRPVVTASPLYLGKHWQQSHNEPRSPFGSGRRCVRLHEHRRHFRLAWFLADPQFRLRNVAIGQCIGTGVLVVVSVAASLISLIVPAEYVGLLGILPVLIGVTKLFAPPKIDGGEEGQRREARGSIAQVLSVTTVTMAGGGDNIGIYSPLFATQSSLATIIVVIVFAILTGLWIAIAHALVSHRAFGAQIRRCGHMAVPFVLIGLGFYILYDAGSLQLIRSVLVA